MKSKNTSILPQNGLPFLISIIRYPQPFCRGSFGLLLFPIDNIYMALIVHYLTHGNQLISFQLDMKKAFLLIIILALVFSKKNLKDANKDNKNEEKTVVEANHYYSNHERNTTYDINSVEKNKSLIFLLKKGDKKDKQLKENPITISLISGEITQTCVFKSFQNMCGINKVEQTSMKLKIQCKETPCELSWIIYQPAVIVQDGNLQIEKFVQVNQDVNHATIIVSCNDPNIKTFGKDIKLYTNSQYTQLEENGIIYYLFDNQKKGYYFITTQNEGARKCAHTVMKHSKDQIQFNKQNNVFQDFLLPSKINQYVFKKQPQFDFRMDSYFHSMKGGHDLSKKEGITLSLIGQNGSNKVNISSITIEGSKSKSVDFSAVFKKPTEKYQTLVLKIQPFGQEILIISMDFISSERQEVNLGETSYFNLKKGDKINYKLVPQPSETDDSRLTHIFTSDDKLFLPTITQCKTKSGCEFTVQAIESGSGNLYLGQGSKKDVNETVYIDFAQSVTKKMKEGQILYLRSTLKGKKAFQAVVNTPNVIIYAARKQKCDIVSGQCHQKVLNSHNPIIYETKSDTDVIFMVQALDTCQFTLTIIDEGVEYIELKDSQPFTYLFDDGEKELLFKFKINTKQDAHFNLIGPVDQLSLSVFNRVQIDQNSQGQVSTDGYITFSQDNIEGLTFIIKVQKREAYLQKYIHFTLLASTKEGNVRLQPGVAQFETIPADETRDFVFEYEPSKDTLLNFYTHNLKNNEINILVQVSTTDQYDKDDQINQYTLDEESDVVDIQQVAKKLCKKQAGENCELFVRLTNKMSVVIDTTVTLLIKDSIIQLKDGIWNSYQINTIAQNSHFYFLPKNKNRSISILYKSDYIDLKLMYTLWKTNDKSINPAEWPFPHQYKGTNTGGLYVTPTKFVHLDPQALKTCWPNCVLLISTFKDEKSLKSVYSNFLQSSQFKIMATSNYLQIPEKQKIDVVLKKDQNKHILIDLKYALQKEAITIFTYFTIGSVQLTGNVYEESNPRCPTPDIQGDFMFGKLQTQISVQTIKKRLEQNEMNLDKNPYICILAQASLDSKFSIQYNSDDGLIKQLILDNFYIQKSQANKITYFQIDGSQQFSVKVTRNSGFPYVSHTICKSGDDFEDCLQKFKEQKGKQLQLADKMTSFSQIPCQKCIVFVSLRSPEPSEINIHVQSKYAETELIQNQILTDQLLGKEQNKYQLTSIKNEEVIINIQIIHGDLQVNISDFSTLNLNKKNIKGSNNIHIVIPPKFKEKTDSPLGGTFLGIFEYSIFNALHLTIKSQNDSQSAMYTITYSSGEPQIYLQDGLISQYAIIPNKSTKFLYKNPNLSKIYLHLSLNDAQILNKMQVKIRALKDEADEDSAVEITPQKPKFNKKTPNPTSVMILPANKVFQIEITNPDKAVQILSIGVNNQEIIYLPMNHQFPVQLGKSDHIYLVINVPFETHLDVQFKKCDESAVSIGYTTSYEDFIKEQFSYEQQMGQQELLVNLKIKSKTRGGIYIKIKSADDDTSLLTVKATFNFVKNKAQKPKAGNKGLVQYKMIDNQNVEIGFTPIICPNSNKACSKQFTYSSIISLKIEDIYAQLVCSSVSFDLQDRKVVRQAELSPISSSNQREGKIYFSQALKENNQFVGVKATNNKTGEIVYYKPLQIATIWGQIASHGKNHTYLILSVFGSIILCCFLLIIYRRKQRNTFEYAPLYGLQ